ncbi:MAG: type II toxin-antitoxin system Phd/YefM family antitoxin [Rectinemataceae bacterium]
MNEFVSLYEAKTHLSHWVEEARAGNEIVICKWNKPVALLSALPESNRETRKIGLAKGTFLVPDTFFDSLPKDLEDLFDGRSP